LGYLIINYINNFLNQIAAPALIARKSEELDAFSGRLLTSLGLFEAMFKPVKILGFYLA